MKIARYSSESLLGQVVNKTELIYSVLFKEFFPSRKCFTEKFKAKDKELEKYLKDNFELLIDEHEDFDPDSIYCYKEKQQIFIVNRNYSLDIYYNIKCKDSIKAADDIVRSFIEKGFLIDVRNNEKDDKIKVLVKDEELGLIYQDVKIKTVDVDINLSYSDDFPPKYQIAKNFLLSNEQGLILWHGISGSGKSTLIRLLISEIGKLVNFIYISPNLINLISNPDLLQFLISQKKEKNTIFIIEDAENIVKSRESSDYTQSSVANLLNIADGFLGDILNIKFILTLNCKIAKIDDALLRKGRLRCEHEFLPLSINKSNKLLEKLGKTERVNKETVLADIYNIDQENYKKEKKTELIGFHKRD